MKLHHLALSWPLLAATVGAATTDGLLAYYDFEETADLGGLNNKAPGATGYHATRYGGGTFDASANPSGPGFAGMAGFDSGYGASDRSQLRVGNALNLAAARGDAIVVPLGSAALGTSFTIAAWHMLAPGPANPAGRYHVFESSNTDNWDVSWGTANTAFTLPQPSYTYLAYVGHTPAGGFGPAGVTTYQWHHVAHVFTAADGITRLDVYLDGAFAGSRSTNTSNMSFTNLHFGRARSGTTGRDWDGMLDEIGLWTRALSPFEVAEIYQRGIAGYGLANDLAALGKVFVGALSSDPTGGLTTGSGVYDLNATVQLAAVPQPGYVFSAWSQPFAAQPAAFTFPATGLTELTAGFEEDTGDPDHDGLSTYLEVRVHGTNPALPDTDGDQLPDRVEVQQTLTNPLLSQQPAVQWVMANLTGGATGGPALARNPANNTVSFRLKLHESNTLVGEWNLLPFAGPGWSVSLNHHDVSIGLPATAAWQRFFRFEGLAPNSP